MQSHVARVLRLCEPKRRDMYEDLLQELLLAGLPLNQAEDLLDSLENGPRGSSDLSFPDIEPVGGHPTGKASTKRFLHGPSLSFRSDTGKRNAPAGLATAGAMITGPPILRLQQLLAEFRNSLRKGPSDVHDHEYGYGSVQSACTTTPARTAAAPGTVPAATIRCMAGTGGRARFSPTGRPAAIRRSAS